MDALYLFILFVASLYANTQALQTNCTPARCGEDTTDIHFPFWLKGQQSERYGHPGFDLACKANTTMIRFPSYGDLVVKSISYDIKKLDLLDPKNCVHEVFLNLNLSLSLFRYYYVIKNHTYLNCSTRLPPSFKEIPCLSGSRHFVYTVESSSASAMAQFSCKAVKTIAIPFAYSPYISDNSFGLGLTWELPGSEDPEAKKSQKSFLSLTWFLNLLSTG